MKRVRLPARSFEVHRAFLRGRRISNAICIVMIAAFTALGLYFASDILAMRREARIWEHGVVASLANADGDAKVKFIFVSYKIRVSYEVDGAPHGGTEEFATIAGGAKTVTSPMVKYDPDEPDAFATSWGIESVAGRWYWVLAMLGVSIFVDTVMGLQLRKTRHEVRRLKAIAAEGDEVDADIVSQKPVTLSNGQATPHVLVTWRGGGFGPFTTQVDTRRGAVGTLALLSTDGKFGMLLTDELYPLEVTDEEITAVRGAGPRVTIPR